MFFKDVQLQVRQENPKVIHMPHYSLSFLVTLMNILFLKYFKNITMKHIKPSYSLQAGLGEVSKMISKLWEQASKEEKQVLSPLDML